MTHKPISLNVYVLNKLESEILDFVICMGLFRKDIQYFIYAGLQKDLKVLTLKIQQIHVIVAYFVN